MQGGSYSLYRRTLPPLPQAATTSRAMPPAISIYGLPTKVQAIVNNEKEGK